MKAVDSQAPGIADCVLSCGISLLFPLFPLLALLTTAIRHVSGVYTYTKKVAAHCASRNARTRVAMFARELSSGRMIARWIIAAFGIDESEFARRNECPETGQDTVFALSFDIDPELVVQLRMCADRLRQAL